MDKDHFAACAAPCQIDGCKYSALLDRIKELRAALDEMLSCATASAHAEQYFSLGLLREARAAIAKAAT